MWSHCVRLLWLWMSASVVTFVVADSCACVCPCVCPCVCARVCARMCVLMCVHLCTPVSMCVCVRVPPPPQSSLSTVRADATRLTATLSEQSRLAADRLALADRATAAAAAVRERMFTALVRHKCRAAVVTAFVGWAQVARARGRGRHLRRLAWLAWSRRCKRGAMGEWRAWVRRHRVAARVMRKWCAAPRPVCPCACVCWPV